MSHSCLSKCYIGREKASYIVRLSARVGLIFESHCAYSKIGPLPSLGHTYTADGGGGGIFGRVYCYAYYYVHVWAIPTYIIYRLYDNWGQV